MPNTNYITDGTLGVKLDRVSTTPEFKLGQTVIGTNGRVYTYGLASEAVATGTCTLNASTFAITDLAGNHTADTALASGEYGWVYRTTSPF
jgi:hypothetical protein